MPKSEETPIFFDPTGKRWLYVRIILVVAVLLLLYAVLAIAPRVLIGHSPSISSNNAAPGLAAIPQLYRDKSTESLANKVSAYNLPVIGSGPLVRIVTIQETAGTTIASDVFTNKPLRQLTKPEQTIAEDMPYAIERYGETDTKRIALTFDDGPDPVYSPQILDALHEAGAQATFFVTGINTVKHPDIANRMVREGHTLGNHSLSHQNFENISQFRAYQEIAQTDHVLRAVTERATPFFRPPYVGGSDQSIRNNVRSILAGQKQGLVLASYTFDPQDWNTKAHTNIALPSFDGKDVVVLLHDAGGDRSQTVQYIKQVAAEAKKHDYTFASFDQLYAQTIAGTKTSTSQLSDRVPLVALKAIFVWPHKLIGLLFFSAVLSILLILGTNIVLAKLYLRRTKYKRRGNGYNPLVSVLVPAYNEEKVLAKTVQSLLRSHYQKIEIIIINDGSKDSTRQIAKQLCINPKVLCVNKRKGGKSTALNRGIRKAKGEILVCIDADTVLPRSTIGKLARHFQDPGIGAVSGIVKVGNAKNALTRWQALEYTISIFLERSAQAYLNAIMIVPGSCGAWRKTAVQEAGGFSKRTFAEDSDLTLALHKASYKIIQDTTACAYTESPQTLSSLTKQRFRWIFGNLQVYWKHRDMVFKRRYGWLGMFVMPYSVIGVLLPFIFIPLLTLLAIDNISAGNFAIIGLFLGLTLIVQLVTATLAVLYAHERLSLLLMVPLTRLIYSPLKTYVLYRAALIIAKGATIAWSKLQRSGSVKQPGHYPRYL